MGRCQDREEKGNKKWAGGWLPSFFARSHSEAEVQEVKKFKFKPRLPGCKGSAFVNIKG